MSTLKIPLEFWLNMIGQLKKRGGGERESGAFILGVPESSRAVRFLCYDDLDEFALETGIITFHASGFVRLWNICQSENLRVLADVHTHPTNWTDQSESDRTHPMVAQRGHFALIVPLFAQRTKRSLNGVGIFEYLGDHNWKKWSGKFAPVQITPL